MQDTPAGRPLLRSRSEPRVIGEPVLRLEDPPLLTGRGQYISDVSFAGELHMKMVRSAFAHGRIRGIDTDEASRSPGAVAVWTAADIADLGPIDFRDDRVEKLVPYRQYVLARERVRYVGDPVAVVFAEDARQAEDAAERVVLDIEELPPLLAADAPPGEFSPGLSTEPMAISAAYGDLDAAFASAHAVVEVDVAIGRHSGVPMEPRGAIARYDTGRDVLELHGAAKVVHRNQEALAKLFGRPLASIHLYEHHVGGGFGIRGEIYPEDVLACAAAMRLGRPVKWIETRHEHLIAANHSRQQRHVCRAAVDAEGRILALDDEFFHDQGAYVRTHGARVVGLTAGMLPGPYHVPAYKAVGHYRLTNKTPCATYRAPGRYESTFVRERLLDAIAHRLNIDRVELRRRNLIPASAIPYARPLEALGDAVEIDSGDYALLLDKALARIGWDELQTALRARRRQGEAVGAGIAVFLEKSGLGPTDGVKVVVDRTGHVEVVTGGASIGQGFETVMAQICAETLGVDYTRIRVVHGRTDRIDHGIGAHAGRATVMTGSATQVAAANVRALALDAASRLMQIPAAQLAIVDGRVVRKDAPHGPSMELGEIARRLAPGSTLLDRPVAGLAAEGWFVTGHMNYPYGVHIAVVRVDRETGEVTVERYLAAFDIGRAVNPMLVEGQIAGGVVQGLGGALHEEFLYDDRGEPLSVTIGDYNLPMASEVPPIETLITEDAPSPLNPLGIKGAGEAGINPVGAVIASAIDDAIGIPGAVTRLPVTPARLREIIARHCQAGGDH